MAAADWITPTEADVLTRLSSPELESYRTAGSAAGESDPLEAQIAATVDHMRMYIARCAHNRAVLAASAAGTIPPRLLHTFLDLVAADIRARIGGGGIVPNDDGRRQRKEMAQKTLEAIARCELQVDDDADIDEPDEAGGGVPSPSVSTRRTRKLNG